MPAIQPVRLKAQTLKLAGQYSQPNNFARGLTELLDSYADHTYKPGQDGEPPPLLATFNVPSPVIRQVWLAVKSLITTDPDATLELSSILWRQPYLELRMLAANLLGELPPGKYDDILALVQTWLQNERDIQMVDVLLTYSLRSIRVHAPHLISDLAERWLTNPDSQLQLIGLRLLLSLVTDPLYSNLPVVFRLISPYVRAAPKSSRSHLVALIQKMAQRTPYETAHLLQQHLVNLDNVDIVWLLRQVITEFPDDLQVSLREAAKRDAKLSGTNPNR